MVTLDEVKDGMEKLHDWALEGDSIVKDNDFPDFKSALEFVNKVGEIAEKHQHHPSIIIDYNQVHLSLTTHAVHGLTAKDFEVAQEIDKL